MKRTPPLQHKHNSGHTPSKLPALLAESHLTHLESVVRFLSGTDRLSAPKLGRHYWVERVNALEENYALVISQKQRLLHLQNLLS